MIPTAAEPDTMSDDDVMTGVKAGSATAFGVLYGRYRARAQGVARSVCRDEGRAEEAVQEAFASIWSTRTCYRRTAGTVAPWVLTIVRYRAIDVMRRDARHAAHRAGAEGIERLPAPGGVADQVAQQLLARDMLRLVGVLPDAQREALGLAFYGELSHAEIAATLGIPIGTVKGRIRLATQRLRGDVLHVVG